MFFIILYPVLIIYIYILYMYINVYSVQIYKYKSEMTIVAFKLFHKETYFCMINYKWMNEWMNEAFI